MVSEAQHATNIEGGQGAGPLTHSDGHHDRADGIMVRRAVKERWAIPEEKRKLLADRACTLALSEDDRAAGIGLRVVKDMVGQNQADEHMAIREGMFLERAQPDVIVNNQINNTQQNVLVIEFDERG